MVEVYTDETVTVDACIDAYNPTYNYGASSYLNIGRDLTDNSKPWRALIKVVAPAEPDGADGSPRPRLRVYLGGTTGAANEIVQVYKITRSATEVLEGTGDASATADGATWATYNGSNNWTTAGGDYSTFLGQLLFPGLSPAGWYEIEIPDLDLDWGESGWILLKFADEAAGSGGHVIYFDSAEGTYDPVIRWYYDDPKPTKVTDLELSAYEEDRRRPLLKWTANTDEDFVQYKIYKSTSSPVTTSDTLVDTLTSQSQKEYIVPYETANIVYFYALFVEDNNNTGSDATKSNEVWGIRPSITGITPSDGAPELFQDFYVTVTPGVIPSTPSPVVNTHVYFQWGSGTDPDQSSAWVPIAENPRHHRYPYVHVYNPVYKVRNSLGLESSAIPGTTITVADAVSGESAPIAIIRASPRVVGLNETVTFYADESYCPDGNRSLNPTAAYMWDKDYYIGAWAADWFTDDPITTTSWSTVGTKKMGLKVDDPGTYSSEIAYIEIEVVDWSTVDLDGLTDGFQFLDDTPGRYGGVMEGPEAYEIYQSAEMPREVRIGGFAYTDTDSDGIPDDIETLIDIYQNGKKVSLTIDGTVCTGIIKGRPSFHNEAGYNGKRDWSCTIALE